MEQGKTGLGIGRSYVGRLKENRKRLSEAIDGYTVVQWVEAFSNGTSNVVKTVNFFVFQTTFCIIS